MHNVEDSLHAIFGTLRRSFPLTKQNAANDVVFHEKCMRAALKEAQKAYDLNESPIGAVIVKDGKIIARAHNLRQTKQDATLHAEMVCISKACRKLSAWHIFDCDLYVTLEPCYMCAGAIIQSHIRHVYFGAFDPKGGAVCSQNKIFDLPHNHHVEYTGGILEEECSALLKKFFKELRQKKIKD
ncbi:MAG: nucleoside deaminase [Clostridiales bacterium]|nr:nucleoside deaminase [Clostridiales bacterium]MBR5417043.1 nucleoside deaminase [Clostridiales bacterium]